MDNVRDVENSDVTVRWLAISRQPIAAAWLKLQIQLGLSPRTIDAYGRGLADFLTFCEWASIDPLRANRAESARYVHDLAPRPGRGGPNVVTVDSGVGLANPTMHLSLVAVRLFYDHLVEEGPRESNPVGRVVIRQVMALPAIANAGSFHASQRTRRTPTSSTTRRRYLGVINAKKP